MEEITIVRISVVVSTYSTERVDCVARCLESLRKQTLRPFEVILVLDPNKALIDSYEAQVSGDVKVISSTSCGLSNARNAGVKIADGEVVAFIDDDAFADENWLKILARNYEDPLVMGVGGQIRPLWEDGRPGWFPEELDWIIGCSYRGLPEHRAMVRNLIGCNMSFRKCVFERIGYFATDIGRVGRSLGGHEDTEFSVRLRESIPECKIVYDPEAIVCHQVNKARANLIYLIRRSFAEGYSKSRFARRRVDPAGVLQVERAYLMRVLTTGISSRLARDRGLAGSLQILALLFSTCLVLIGYMRATASHW